MEHDERADELERDAGAWRRTPTEVEEQIDETRREWEAKEQDPSVPGARPEPTADDESDEET